MELQKHLKHDTLVKVLQSHNFLIFFSINSGQLIIAIGCPFCLIYMLIIFSEAF